MLKSLFVFAVVLSMAACAQAITVDGNVSDWDAGWFVADPVSDGEGEAEVVNWGAQVSGGMLYGFIEMDKAISIYASGSNDIWAGLWIDVDNQGGPGDTDSSLYHTSSHTGHEWAGGVFQSFDINIEWGVNTSHWGEGYNYWGGNPTDPAKYDDVSEQGNAITGGATAFAGNFIEFSCPVSGIIAELGTAHLSDNVTAASSWSMGVWVEASINGAGPWGGDNSDIVMRPGDFNLDGVIDVTDLGILATNYGTTGGMTVLTGDADWDTNVNVNDLGILATGYGTGTAAAAAVPEPATIGLMGLGALSLLLWRRKK